MQFGIFDHVDASGLPQADHYETRLRLVEALDGLNFRSYHVAEHHGTSLGLAPSPSVLSVETQTFTSTPWRSTLTTCAPLRAA